MRALTRFGRVEKDRMLTRGSRFVGCVGLAALLLAQGCTGSGGHLRNADAASPGDASLADAAEGPPTDAGNPQADAGVVANDGGDAAGSPSVPILADYAGAPRESTVRADGFTHVDSPLLVSRLVALHANTYAFLVERSTDWEDLHEYLPLAEAAGLKTWVYLVPPTERPANYPPFQGDYVAWGNAIGKLAAQYPSLTAWVIDDFTWNLGTFTPQLTCAMTAAAKAASPSLRFYPIEYYPQVLTDFADPGYSGCIDGVVFPYTDLDSNANLRSQIDAIAQLRTAGVHIQLSWPSNTSSTAGQYARYTATCVSDGSPTVTFTYSDSYNGATAGYHSARVMVGGQEVWSQDPAGVEPDTPVHLSLAQQAPAGSQLPIAFEVFEEQGVGNFGVKVSFDHVVVSGCGPTTAGSFTYSETGTPFSGTCTDDPYFPRLRIVTMIYTAPTSWHAAPPTPQVVEEGLQIGLQAWSDHVTQGVITYKLNKDPLDPTYAAVQSLYQQWASP